MFRTTKERGCEHVHSKHIRIKRRHYSNRSTYIDKMSSNTPDLSEDELINSDDPTEGILEATWSNSSTTNDNNNTYDQIYSTCSVDNLIPANLMSINNLEIRSDGDYNDTNWKALKDKELKEDICLAKEETQSSFLCIFQIMNIEAW